MFSPASIQRDVEPAEMPAPDSLKTTGLVDHERGGVAIEDPSQGLDGHTWRCEVVGSDVMLSVDGGAPSLLFQRAGIMDVALAFTQSMQPTVAWRQTDGTIWLRFYDGTLPGYRIESFGSGLTPRLTLDDKRVLSSAISDVILAYMVGGELRYRIQRERFAVEHVLQDGFPSGTELVRIGMVSLRVQFVVSVPAVGG